MPEIDLTRCTSFCEGNLSFAYWDSKTNDWLRDAFGGRVFWERGRESEMLAANPNLTIREVGRHGEPTNYSLMLLEAREEAL